MTHTITQDCGCVTTITDKGWSTDPTHCRDQALVAQARLLCFDLGRLAQPTEQSGPHKEAALRSASTNANRPALVP